MNDFQRRRLLTARRARMDRRAAFPPWLIILAALGAAGSIAAATGVGVVFAIYQNYASDYVPIEEKLLQTQVGFTEIYDRGGPEDGVLLGNLENRDAQLLDPVKLEDISPWVIEATISTEDNGFWTHPGVSLTGLARAFYENYILDEFGSGGSTITQQLIKNIYICPTFGSSGERELCNDQGVAERTLDRKLREITYAMELERDYSKEEILEWYLNQISYASRYVGIQAAAQGYFHKDASELNLAEAALLAGIPAAPTDYHPRLNCVLEEGSDTECVVDGLGRTLVTGAAKARQEQVLDLMVEHKRATPQEAAEAKAFDLRVYQATNPVKASAFIDDQVEPRLLRMCEAGVLEMLPGADDCYTSVHGAGYKVTTTLDWAMTEKATQMIDEYISQGLEIGPQGCNCHNGAIATIEPQTGQLVVYAANRDPSNLSDPRVNGDIDQLVEVNQPGSSFKPAVYLAWFDTQNKAPLSHIWDTNPLTIGGTAITNPRGAPGTEGLISARAALGGSQNVPAFRAAYEAGIDNVIATAKKLGITTLEQGFDPTFSNHDAITYGPSIATGGANIRIVDMAYMNATIANMGMMVGVPHYAEYIELDELRSLAVDTGLAYDTAWAQRNAFQRGDIRLPGTRELDPVVILEIRASDGEVIFRQGEPDRIQTIDAGSVWLLHSIMSDCTARFIIWGCGSSNDDNGLDWFVPGYDARFPAGVKTGTQQGFLSAADTLEVWTNGYSRYAATAVWVGNANNELINDGPAHNYASAHTVLWLYKNWMGEYHRYLRDERGVFITPEGFEDLQPPNVAQSGLRTPITDRGREGGCDQVLVGWVRTDASYEDPCETAEIDTRNGMLAGDQTPSQFREERKFVKLPALEPGLAIELAKKFSNIAVKPTEVSTGQPAVDLVSPANASTITRDTEVVGSVGTANLESWRLEIGRGPNPSEWTELGTGTSSVSNSVLGHIELDDLEDGVYTIRLTAEDSVVGSLMTSVFVNVRGAGGDDNGGPGFPGFPGRGGDDDDDDDDHVSFPTGFQDCVQGCGEPPYRVICPPGFWFVDKGHDFDNTEGWPETLVEPARNESLAGVAAAFCGV